MPLIIELFCAQVSDVKDEDVVCLIKNSATLSGPLYTLHVSGIHIDLPTLTDKDKEVYALFRHLKRTVSFSFADADAELQKNFQFHILHSLHSI